MANNESEFKMKLKKLCANRALVVTVVTLLVATGIIIAATIAANRTKKPLTGNDPVVTTPAATGTTPSDPTINDETLPTYNGGETRPVGGDAAEDPDKYVLPVSGKLQKSHDTTLQVYSNTMGDYRVHLGLDIASALDTPVLAVADGKVEKIWQDAMMGTCMALAHADETVTVYKNLKKELPADIAVGVEVKQGQQIACVGDTATLELADEPHLHFEMTVKGLSVNPLDYFSKASVETLSKDTAFEGAAVESGTMAETGTAGK